MKEFVIFSSFRPGVEPVENMTVFGQLYGHPADDIALLLKLAIRGSSAFNIILQIYRYKTVGIGVLGYPNKLKVFCYISEGKADKKFSWYIVHGTAGA